MQKKRDREENGLRPAAPLIEEINGEVAEVKPKKKKLANAAATNDVKSAPGEGDCKGLYSHMWTVLL